MKDLLLSSRVLVHFDNKLPLVFSCDASPYGVGVVLAHKMDNGDERPVCFASRTLTAAEQKYSQLEQFLKKNGVKHVKTPPYHPASNGLAERAVQTFKEGMRKLKDGSLDTKLSRFLFKYRMTPQSTTGVTPAELMFGRRLRSPLDNVRPDLDKKHRQNQEKQKQAHDRRARHREFQVGDSVYAKNYGSGNAWLPGKVTAVHGSMLVTVKLLDGRSVCKHFDQFISRVESHETSPEVDCENLDLPQNQDDELPQITSAPSVEVQTPSPETEQPQPSSSGTQTDSTVTLSQKTGKLTLRLQCRDVLIVSETHQTDLVTMFVNFVICASIWSCKLRREECNVCY